MLFDPLPRNPLLRHQRLRHSIDSKTEERTLLFKSSSIGYTATSWQKSRWYLAVMLRTSLWRCDTKPPFLQHKAWSTVKLLVPHSHVAGSFVHPTVSKPWKITETSFCEYIFFLTDWQCSQLEWYVLIIMLKLEDNNSLLIKLVPVSNF